MTRMKCFLAVLAAVAAVAFVAPAAHAVVNPCFGNAAISCHVAGAGSSAQFLTMALAMDKFAVDNSDGVTTCPYHWTAKNSAFVVDNRDSRILPEKGSVVIVWIAACSDATGNTGVTDIWTDVQIDSTVGVRTFMAQQTTGAGAQIQIVPAAGGNLISPTNLWEDNHVDVSLVTAPTVSAAIGTAATGGQHLNVGLTDIRPEDALYATTRALGTLNTTTWSGLGYKGPTGNIGAPIYSAMGTGTQATPIKFALSGTDPITHLAVRSYTTVPLGAAPMIFAFKNQGLGFSSSVADLKTGIGVTGTASKKLAHLWDGTTVCDTHNGAFGGNDDGLGTPITVMLREPLSGTMNTTEFTEFRTAGNTADSQEKGIINPFNTPYNPLNLGCPTHGHRMRGVGTGEIVNAIQQTGGNPTPTPDPNVIGYFFWGFANAAKLTGANYNYLTLDGVDPIGLTTTNQQLPSCSGPCPASLWPGSISFPSLRNGTYKAWSLLRWIVPSPDTDPLGPTALAAAAQGFVTTAFADYVPLSDAADAQGGLHVYRSHFKQGGVTSPNNGAKVGSCGGGQACTLAGGSESGGDEGGLIQPALGVASGFPVATGGNVHTVNGSATVSWKTGPLFIPNGTVAGCTWTSPEIGEQINITGVSNGPFTILTVVASGKSITVSPAPNTTKASTAYSFVSFPSVTNWQPGVLCKKQ